MGLELGFVMVYCLLRSSRKTFVKRRTSVVGFFQLLLLNAFLGMLRSIGRLWCRVILVVSFYLETSPTMFAQWLSLTS